MGVLRNPREIHHAATEAVQPLDAAIDAIQKKMHRIW
jgi:hypothetical protein